MLIVSLLDGLTDKLKPLVAKLEKTFGTKQEGDRSGDTLRGVVKSMKLITLIPETETNAKYNDLYNSVSKNEKLKALFETV